MVLLPVFGNWGGGWGGGGDGALCLKEYLKTWIKNIKQQMSKEAELDEVDVLGRFFDFTNSQPSACK